MELLTLDFRDAFKQLHVVPSERPFLAGAAMDGFFYCRIVLFGVGSGPLVWCRVAAWVMRSTRRGWEPTERRPIALLMIPSLRFVERLPIGVGWPWECCSGGGPLGLKLACEKGSFGPEALWIGTQFTVKSVVNKVEISFPAKKNAEILAALEELMDNARGMVKHADIRKLAGKESWVAGFLPQLKPFVRQLWASLYKDRGDQKWSWCTRGRCGQPSHGCGNSTRNISRFWSGISSWSIACWTGWFWK